MKTTTQIDLMPFCDPEYDRLKVPFRLDDGFIYATDGRHAVRIPDDGRALPEADRRRPDVSKTFQAMPLPIDGWKPLFRFVRACECKIGTVKETCDSCDGEGERE